MKRPAVHLCALSLAALVLGSFAADSPAQNAKEKEKGRKRALLIGVRSYERSVHFTDLKYTENDVEKLAAILKHPAAGYHTVRVLTTTRGEKNKDDAPTAENIRALLARLVADRKKEDTLLIALSGHGVELEVEDPDGKGKPKQFAFFCPGDADLVNVSYSTGRSKKLIALAEVFDALGKCGAGVKLMLVDACRHELKADSSARSLDVESIRIPKGVGVLFGCSSGQRTFESKKVEHGVFFHYVLKGMRGAAKSKTGEVTWASLADYVAERVSEDIGGLVGGGARQTPHALNNLSGRSPTLLTREIKELPAEVKGGAKYDSPEAVFDAIKAAAKKRDHKTYVNALTPDGLEVLSGIFVFAGVGLKLVKPKDGADEKLKERGKELVKLLDKQGMDDAAYLEILAALKKAGFPKSDAEATLKVIRLLGQRIKEKDQAAFCAAALDVMTADKQSFNVWEGYALRGVKIKEDTATAMLVGKKDGKIEMRAIGFQKFHGSWRIDHHMPPLTPGKVP